MATNLEKRRARAKTPNGGGIPFPELSSAQWDTLEAWLKYQFPRSSISSDDRSRLIEDSREDAARRIMAERPKNLAAQAKTETTLVIP